MLSLKPRVLTYVIIAVLLAVFAFGASEAAEATTYYFSSSLGNDGWSGTLPEPNAQQTDGPKASLGAADNLLDNTAQPGDQVLFRRGDTFTASGSGIRLATAAGSADNWIVVGAYGSGDKPVFDVTGTGSVIYSRGSDGTPTSYIRFENIRMVTSGDPGNRPKGVTIIETYRSNEPHHITFDGCEVVGLKHGFDLQEADLAVKNCLIKDNYGIDPETGHTQGIYTNGDNIHISGNTFDHNGKPDSWYDWQCYISHCSGAVFENNELKNGLDGLKLRANHNATIRDNVIHNMGLVGITCGGDNSSGTGNIVIERNLIYDTVDGITIKDQSGGGDIGIDGLTIRNNILHSNKETGPKGNGYNAYLFVSDHPVQNVDIYNNLIYGVTNKRTVNIGNSSPSGSAMKNNLFVRSATDNVMVEIASGALGYLTMDNNLYDFPGGTIITVGGSNYGSLSDFRNDYPSQEQNGQEGDPNLADPANGDFHLTGSSTLAIDTGADASGIVDDDYDELSRPIDGDNSGTARWDIGPYEYSPSGNQPPTANDDSYSTDEDDTLNVGSPGVLGNDSDPEDDSLTASLDTDVSHGSLTLNSDGSFDYTPDADYNGSDSFTYKAYDGASYSAAATVDLTVNAVNDAPVAADDSYSTGQDTQLNVSTPGVLGNDTDVDGDNLTAIKVSDPSNGSVSLNSDGSFTYTPDAGWTGDDSFTYEANDGTADSNTATVTITVYEVNDPPTANDDSYSTDEDTALNVSAPGVLDNDSDPESDPLTAIKVSDPSHGSVTLNSDGSFDYTPDADWHGGDSFTYKANDGSADSNTATVSLTVNAVNDAPVASDDSYSTDQDTDLNVSAPGVLGNDNDVDGDALTAVLVTDVSHGALTLHSDGSFDYSPDAGWAGDDSFTYEANDGTADSNTATVTITVEAPAEIYVDDDYDSGTPGWGVDHFDSIQDGIDAASGGDTVIVYGGTYSENISFSGKDITVRSEDPDDSSVVAATVIDGGAAGHVVSFSNGETSAAVLEGFTIQNGSAVLGGGIYCDAASPTIRKNVITANTVTEDGGGIYTYNSAALIERNIIHNNTTEQNGGGIWCDTGSPTISNNLIYENTAGWNGGGVYCWSSSPTIENCTIADNTATAESGTTNGGGIRANVGASPEVVNCLLWGNAADEGAQIAINDNTTLTVSYSDVQGGEAAVAVQSADCTLNWSAGNLDSDPLFVDAANDDYHIDSGSPCIDAADGDAAPATDLDGNSRVDDPNTTNTGTGTPDYADIGAYEYQTAANLAPTASDDSYSTDEDTTLNVSAPGVLDNDTDPESDPLTAVLVSDVSNGSLTLNSDGSFDYTPDADYNGSDSFTYKANDGTSDSNTATVDLTVNPVNDAPVASDDSYDTDEDTDLNVSAPGVLDNDSDVDGDSLTAVLVADVTNGTLTLNSDGSFDYTPDAGWSGQDSFTYKANDGTVDSNNATVTITVNAVNDPPTANDDSYSTDEDTELDVSAPGVLGNDTDPEDDALTASVVSDPNHGSLMFYSDGAFSYSPVTDYNGSDSFTYRANDGTSDSNTATVNLTVNPVNDAPVAVDDSYEAEKDTTLNVAAPGVLDNDSDVEDDTLSAVKVTDPGHGSVTLDSDGSFDYTPDSGYTGDDSFTYKANDGTADSGNATVSITVTEGADIYVDDDYDSGTPGWQVDHFAAIQDGIDAASTGDVVLVYAGTYAEHVDFSGKDITVRSEDPDDPAVVAATVIDGTDSGRAVKFQNGETDAAVLEGFTVRNGSDTGVYVSYAAATISKNVIEDSGGAWGGGGILVEYAGSTPVVITGNTITNNTASSNGGGMYVRDSDNVTLSNNIFCGNISQGANTWEGGGAIQCYISTLTLENNLFYENDSAGRGGALFVRGGSVTLTNNTIVDNSADDDGGGLFVRESGTTVDIDNCIVWNNSALDVGDEIYHIGGTVTIDYSDVDQSGVSGTVTWGDGNVDSAPLFVDAANDDYHIGSGSPCIDAADGDAAPGADLEGYARYDDPNTTNTGTGTPDYADIGCYEYQGS